MAYKLASPEQTIDLGADGGKWRHGWIPLNAAAMAIAARKGIKGHGAPSAPSRPVGGKSRLSTSTARPSRLKLKGERGRQSDNPFQRAVDRGDIPADTSPKRLSPNEQTRRANEALHAGDAHAQVKRAFPDRTTPDGFMIQHRAEVGDNKQPTGAFSVSVMSTDNKHTAGKRYTKISDGTNAEIDALGRARDSRRGGKELDARYTMQSQGTATREPFKTMKQRRDAAALDRASGQGSAANGLKVSHAKTKEHIGTVTKLGGGKFGRTVYSAQHKDDAKPHAGGPFNTQREAMGALVLQHESRIAPKQDAEGRTIHGHPRHAVETVTPLTAEERSNNAMAAAAKARTDLHPIGSKRTYSLGGQDRTGTVIGGRGNTVSLKDDAEGFSVERHQSSIHEPSTAEPTLKLKPEGSAPVEHTVEDHVRLAIAHNDAAKRALDRGDTAAAGRHVAKAREHNTAAVTKGNAALGQNAIDRSELEAHAAALAIPAGERTPEQQKAAADAVAYAKKIRAARKATREASAAAIGPRGHLSPVVVRQPIRGRLSSSSEARAGAAAAKAKPSDILTHAESEQIRTRIASLSRMNSVDKSAIRNSNLSSHPAEADVKARARELGQLKRKLVKHYVASGGSAPK